MGRFLPSGAQMTARGSYMMKLIMTVVVVLFLVVSISANARGREPCSGAKSGISHCQGATFVCNDGSVSASKKHCARQYGNRLSNARGLISNSRDMTPATRSASKCACRSGSYCTGPRGGQFCYSDSGAKSYLRR